MRVILIAFALLFVFFLSSRVKLSHTEDAPHDLVYCIFEDLSWEFAVAICRRNLPWLFAARNCRGNLPQKFAVAICRGFFCIYKRILFCICEQILFTWRQTFFICVQKFLICEIFFINSASSCYCRGSYWPL